jgi:hypothetical protein
MSLNMGMLASYDQSVELLWDNLGAGEMSTMLGKTMLFSYLILQYYVFFISLLGIAMHFEAWSRVAYWSYYLEALKAYDIFSVSLEDIQQ